jgi:hypothetical protein
MPAGEPMSSLRDGLYAIDPLRDDRWPELIARYPNASVFHTRGWLVGNEFDSHDVACSRSDRLPMF